MSVFSSFCSPRFERPHRWLLCHENETSIANSVYIPFQVPATYLSFNLNGMKLMKWHFNIEQKETTTTSTTTNPLQTRTIHFNCMQNSINRTKDFHFIQWNNVVHSSGHAATINNPSLCVFPFLVVACVNASAYTSYAKHIKSRAFLEHKLFCVDILCITNASQHLWSFHSRL